MIDPGTGPPTRPLVTTSRAVGLLCLVVAAAAMVYAVRLATIEKTAARPAWPPVPGRLDVPPTRPLLLFSTMTPETYGRLALASLDQEARFVADLTCDRVYFAAGRGICLTTEYEGLTPKYTARFFDDEFQTVASTSLTGLPSRARVSPDGRWAAVTVFERGHSYAVDGFSTRSTILDTRSGLVVGDLEQFAVSRDGVPFKSVDFNFWGVTFARDEDRFYATLATGGTPYLVEGRIDTKAVRVLRAGVECPSLSPDNRRIAYKHRLDESRWQIHVLDLATGSVTALDRETRSVDDQVEWLDDQHVVYHITAAHGADVWALRTDGTEPPRVIKSYAYSPAVVH